MTRAWTVAAGVAAAVALVGAGAVAGAAPWADDDTTTPSAGTTTQARWGQGEGGGPGQHSVNGHGQSNSRGQAGQHGQGAGGPGAAGAHAASVTGANLPPPAASISAETEQMLAYMAEEEKLAHDLYVALGEQYDARQFDRIAASETQHLEAVRVLLERYGLDDPTADAEPGTFTDGALQDLYDDLLASGSQSLAAAADAGITVEETDIADLTEALDSTEAADVEQVLTSLRHASQRHLAAFERLAARA